MALRSLSTSALRAELARREKDAKKYIARHAKMSRMLAALEVQLADLGLGAMSVLRGKRRGRPPGSRNKRRGPGRPPGSKNKRRGRKPGQKQPRNTQSLSAALAAGVRPGSIVSPAQAASIVRARGYKTTAKKFGMAVAHTLADHKGFKRTGRGQYLRKGGAAPTAPARRGPKPKMGRSKMRRPNRRGRKATRRAVKASRKAATPKPVVAPTIVV